MGNSTLGLKKFFTNKNTVTVIGVLLIIVVLYIGYNMRIDAEVSPVRVAYAVETINPGVQITEDMIAVADIPPAMIQGEIYTDPASIIGKYSNADSVIPAGSLFYQRSVVNKEQLPANIILDYPEGYVLYEFSVTTESTYGNSMFPGNYIDIYLKAINTIAEGEEIVEYDKIMVGKLIENVKILAVLDTAGNAVFENLEEQKQPSQIIVALPEEYHILLRKAEYLRAFETTLIPVPTAESLKEEPGEVTLSSETIRDFINRVTVFDENLVE